MYIKKKNPSISMMRRKKPLEIAQICTKTWTILKIAKMQKKKLKIVIFLKIAKNRGQDFPEGQIGVKEEKTRHFIFV